MNNDKEQITKGQYFHYTVGDYSNKNYYLVKALKDIDSNVYENSNKILQLIVRILSLNDNCCKDKNWML